MSEDFDLVKHGKWCPEEDDLLRNAINQYGEKHWRQIALNVPGRTPIQCLHRWSKILKPGLVKGPWSAQEDKLVRDWVEKEGPTKWSQCSNLVPGRSGKQCRERWFNILHPHVKKGDWKTEEDEVIFRMYQNLGPRWTLIAKQLPGRTENSIKNRFYSTVRKMKQQSKFELDDSKLDLNSIRNVEDNNYEESEDQRMMNLLQQVQQLEHMLHSTRKEILVLESSLDVGNDSLPVKSLGVKSDSELKNEDKA